MQSYQNVLLNALLSRNLTNAKERLAFIQKAPNSAKPSANTRQLREDCASAGLRIVTHRDERFPARLAAIPDPPLLLFVAGNLEALSNDSLAIVGGREASGAGRRFAAGIATELSNAGLTIVSGLALGIDAAAHQGALQGASPTIAVLGGGHLRLYPTPNKRLARRICEQGGAVISEYPPHLRPTRYTFPERNRIVSGLAHGVLVIEARERSGSLITANYALEQGREVMAVPGPVDSRLSRGGHALLREGAGLVESSEDVLAALGFTAVTSASEAAEVALEPMERQVLDALDYRETSMDTLVGRTGLKVEEILQALISLELVGFVESEARGYIRAATR